MAREEPIVGLDIGTTKICTVIGEADARNRLEIKGVGVAPSRGLRRGVVIDLADTVEAIRQSVEMAQRMAGIEVSRVFAGVTGSHISCLNSRGVVTVTGPDRRITEADVDRALEAAEVLVLPPDRQVIHTVTREFIVDGQEGIRRPVGMAGTRLEVETHVVTGAVTLIQNVVQCMQQAGLQAESLVLEPIATAEAVVLEEEKELGVLLADIGGGTTDVAIFFEGSIAFSSALPVGGSHVTRDISVGLRTPVQAAEKLKLERGCALVDDVDPPEKVEVLSAGTGNVREMPRVLLAEIIQARITEILSLVKGELQKSSLIKRIAAGAVITGGGVLLPGATRLAEKVLDLPVRTGMPDGLTGFSDSVKSPIYSTGVGLVRYGVNQPVSTDGMPSLARVFADFFARLRNLGRRF